MMSPNGASYPRWYDAHNHLQDDRLAEYRMAILEAAESEGIEKMVVNGSCEEDWPAVMTLARQSPRVLPAFGCHPWYVKQRSPAWQDRLQWHLDQVPAGVGEIGLDRWIQDYDLADQERVFIWQLRLAAERNLPVSIHCLQAWGHLLQILQAEPRPARGFLLHSFGGPQEMIPALAKLGAFFSLPGYFAHERKSRQRETFRHVPLDRLLIETDAPDQLLPDARNKHPLRERATGKPLNHPANLAEIYRFAAELLGEPLDTFARRVEENFERHFGALGGVAEP